MKSCRLQVGGSREAFLIMKSPCVVEHLDVHIHLGFVHSCHHLVILCKFDRRFSFSSRWGGDSLMSHVLVFGDSRNCLGVVSYCTQKLVLVMLDH